MNEPAHVNWARALTDDVEFKHEQAALGRCWTLVGISHDLKNDGDWFRATLGGRSVFVQRFGDSLRGFERGFENRCAHVSSPCELPIKVMALLSADFIIGVTTKMARPSESHTVPKSSVQRHASSMHG
jgi:hypothetical protein